MPANLEALFLKFLQFGLVGLSGMVLDFGLTFLAKEKLRWNKYLASSLGFVAACGSNYLLNRVWTFHSADPAIGWQFSKFFLVSLTGLLLHNALLYLLTDKLKQPFYLSKALAIGLVFFWNFGLNYLFTFRT
ncbi:MAG: GtrA family protein [Adhaeribacter sp.]